MANPNLHQAFLLTTCTNCWRTCFSVWMFETNQAHSKTHRNILKYFYKAAIFWTILTAELTQHMIFFRNTPINHGLFFTELTLNGLFLCNSQVKRLHETTYPKTLTKFSLFWAINLTAKRKCLIHRQESRPFNTAQSLQCIRFCSNN